MFDCTVEIEVAVDATDVTSGQRRHINNGFLTLAAFRADKVRNTKLIDKILDISTQNHQCTLS